MDLRTYLADRASDALRLIDPEQGRDTYVVSFYVADEEDDPRSPTLTVGTNTQYQVELHMARAAAQRVAPPRDEAEARWNYAYFLQNQLTVVGDMNDPAGAAFLRHWLDESSLWYLEPDDDDEGAWATADRLGVLVTEAFTAACVDAAKSLHASGLITEVFRRPIPVLVHELEYYERIAVQAVDANPPGLAADFCRWVLSP